jgi:tetratricopeptide (TPR) repeat protein
LGRCEYKRVAYGNEDTSHLGKAEQALTKAVKDKALAKKLTPVEEAEALSWLGEVYGLEGKTDLAEAALKRVTEDLVKDQKVRAWPDLRRALRYRAALALDEARRLKHAKKAPGPSLRLAEKMADVLQDVDKKPPAQADAAWIVGQSYQIEDGREPKKALDVYQQGIDSYSQTPAGERNDEHLVRVSLARLDCLLTAGHEALGNLRPDSATLVKQAEAAIEASKSARVLDPWLKADAYRIACLARQAAAADPSSSQKEAHDNCQAAFKYLEKGIALIPKVHAEAVRWRLDAVDLLLCLLRDKEMGEDKRKGYWDSAAELLSDAASLRPLPEERARMSQLRRDLKEVSRDPR